ncbi:MAG: gamma-glutamylcyclotransferase [Kiloniellaceae bacterium]
MTRLRWWITKLRYRRHGVRLAGRPEDPIWHFAFGSNMNEDVFCGRRGMALKAWRVGRVKGYRLRFNLEGRPRGKAAPANIAPDPTGEVWGVLYLITRAGLVHLDYTEGVPGRRYRHLWVEAEDQAGERLQAVTYIADGKPDDGRPSPRYLTLIREGARAHGLPEAYLEFLDSVPHAE